MVEAQRRPRSVERCVVLSQLHASSVVLWLEGQCAPRLYRRVPANRPRAGGDRRNTQVDVRIGIVQSIKELEVELAEDADRDAIIADIEGASRTPRRCPVVHRPQGSARRRPGGQGGLRRGGGARGGTPRRFRRPLSDTT